MIVTQSMGAEVEGMVWFHRTVCKGFLKGDPTSVCLSHSSLIPSGENMATDGRVDLSRLEVSLTLTNKFEGLEADADHNSNQSLLLRWVW